MATTWSEAKGPQCIWSLQDVVLDQIGVILEARAAAELQLLDKINHELLALNAGLEALLFPTRVAKAKLSDEANPIGDVWRSTFFGQFITQFCSLIQDEFTAGRDEYNRLKEELDTFRSGAQAIRNSRPSPDELERVEHDLVTAVRRCENSKEIYDRRCKDFQEVNSKPKGRLGSLKNLKHIRNSSSSSLLSLDDPEINTADHDYRKAIVIANTLRNRRISLYRSGYANVESSTNQTLALVKSSLLVQASLAMERSSIRAHRYEEVVHKLMHWEPSKDAAELCAYVPNEMNLMPPEMYRHDAAMGWMKRVVFCVPLSYLPCNREGVPRILVQSFEVCEKILRNMNWAEEEVAQFAATPKLSASRFEEVIVSAEREEGELSVNVRSIPEAIGLMNYLFFSLPRPFLQLNSSVASDPEQVKTWWESSKDKRKVAELFRSDTMDKTCAKTLKFILEQLSQILPHAKNLHIVDVAMAWSRPLFKTPKPSSAEITVLCVLLRQALLLHRHNYDERWVNVWNPSTSMSQASTTPRSSHPTSPTIAPRSSHPTSPTTIPRSSNPTSPTIGRLSRQPTFTSPLSRQGTLTRKI